MRVSRISTPKEGFQRCPPSSKGMTDGKKKNGADIRTFQNEKKLLIRITKPKEGVIAYLKSTRNDDDYEIVFEKKPDHPVFELQFIEVRKNKQGQGWGLTLLNIWAKKLKKPCHIILSVHPLDYSVKPGETDPKKIHIEEEFNQKKELLKKLYTKVLKPFGKVKYHYSYDRELWIGCDMLLKDKK